MSCLELAKIIKSALGTIFLTLVQVKSAGTFPKPFIQATPRRPSPLSASLPRPRAAPAWWAAGPGAAGAGPGERGAPSSGTPWGGGGPTWLSLKITRKKMVPSNKKSTKKWYPSTLGRRWLWLEKPVPIWKFGEWKHGPCYLLKWPWVKIQSYPQ